jgi:hypothetical protein
MMVTPVIQMGRGARLGAPKVKTEASNKNAIKDILTSLSPVAALAQVRTLAQWFEGIPPITGQKCRMIVDNRL